VKISLSFMDISLVRYRVCIEHGGRARVEADPVGNMSTERQKRTSPGAVGEEGHFVDVSAESACHSQEVHDTSCFSPFIVRHNLINMRIADQKLRRSRCHQYIDRSVRISLFHRTKHGGRQDDIADEGRLNDENTSASSLGVIVLHCHLLDSSVTRTLNVSTQVENHEKWRSGR